MSNKHKFKYRYFAEALYEALNSDSFYRTLENSVLGSSIIRKEAMLRYIDYSMIESEVYGKLYIPKEHKFGVSVWSKSIDNHAEMEKKIKKKDFLTCNLGKKALNTYLMITDFMSQKAIGLVSNESWYLSIVGLKPLFQNKGLGSGLIKPILEELDSKKISTYLETFTPRNITFYERLGYITIGSFHEPITNAQYWIMSRQAK